MMRAKFLILASVMVLHLGVPAASEEQASVNDAYAAALERMHEKMRAVAATDPAVSYAGRMIAHHEGAIEMSEIVLKNTKDPLVHRMAVKIINDQRRDILKLNKWLAAH